jgi:2'-5' RNA ligase
VRGAELPPSPSSAFTGTTVTLFRSWLGQGAARYEALRRVELEATAVAE